MQALLKRNAVCFAVLLVLLLSAYYFGRHYDLSKSQNQAEQQVQQLSHYLKAELTRFASIPHFISDNQLLSQFIENSDLSNNAINSYLVDIQQASGASDAYVLDTNGDVIASSNWLLDYSYVGSNFAFRPYFYQALAGQPLAYFALGQRSQERGIYFSEPIYNGNQVIGVVVLKINVSKFENDRQLLNTSQTSDFYLMLDDGVIAMSNQSSWRLNTFQELSDTVLQKLIKSRRYLDHKPSNVSTTIINVQGINLLDIKQNTTTKQYVFADAKIGQLNGKISVLVDVTSVSLEQIPRLIWLSLFYVLALIISYSLMARFAGYKKLLFSRHSLEQEVIERTQALEKAQLALIQTAKLATIGQLSAGINHEINQPLSAMNTYLVSAKRLIAKGNINAAQENIVIVQGLIDRVHQIVGQLKHFSKPAQTQLRSISLAQLLKNAMLIASAQLKQNQVKVKPIQINDEVCVWVDGIKFEQVLVNVITNASQAMDKQSVKELSFELELFDDRVKLSILDTGPGIEQHALNSIFEPFYSTKSSNGLGLGLSISKQIIQSFDGCLTAHNRPNGGAQFIITLASDKGAL
ncbi:MULTISPECIES: cache domain-containing protein [unclassified Pseudoalteromonas]|uniref:sensor histidine kinase n=1 Tax=unclassified Pseudoalteromonas TaxID=194690 RepID=UPI0025B56F80|nr:MULTISPECIES: cache domain-containing protein [unclassified Pseudoalteromonas]MDN3377776.1 cache domain-containing protein [Pseudoalteromonas sp. APC 3893]MDN3385972.1 cache domain-containing protein [Pseudoalteromonas sp. APC 4017]